MIFIVVVTYAGLSYAARNGRHIRMSAIYDAMPAKTRKVLMIVMASVTSAFMFSLSYYSKNYFRIYQGSGLTEPGKEYRGSMQGRGKPGCRRKS